MTAIYEGDTRKLSDLTVQEYGRIFFPDRSSSFRAPEPVATPPAPILPKQGVDYFTAGDLIRYTEDQWEGLLGYKIEKSKILDAWVNESDKKFVVQK